jgi:curli biogenesis system outer membrane secretion channel CsgG
MKRLFLAITASIVISSCATTGNHPKIKRQIVAVPMIINSSTQKLQGNVLSSFTDQFVTDLIRTGHFYVVERSRLQEIIKEHKLSLSDYFKSNDAIKAGKLASAEYVIIAAISGFSHKKNQTGLAKIVSVEHSTVEVTFNARMIKTDTGVAVAAGTSKAIVTINKVNMSLGNFDLLKVGHGQSEESSQLSAELKRAIKDLADDLTRQRSF